MKLKALTIAAGVLLASAGLASAATVTNDLNLRSGPGTGYRVIETMPAGANVRVVSCGGSWCRVRWHGRVGYASASYLGGGRAYAAPPPVYYAPPPVVRFGFGFGNGHRWHNRGRDHGRHHGRHHRRHR